MTKSKNSSRPWWKKLLTNLLLSLIIFVIIIGLVWWQWPNITSWVTNTSLGIIQTFGWGILLMALAILAIVEVSLVKPRLFLSYWNKWIGGILIFVSIWGILGLGRGGGVLENVSLGGRIGQGIIGSSLAIGLLIVLVLFFVGLFFMFPRFIAGLIAGIFSWIASLFKREPAGATVPLPGPSTTPNYPGPVIGEAQPELKNTAFPRYKNEPKPRPQSPVYGSKNWLWNRLHGKTEEAPPVPQPGVEQPVNPSSLLSDNVPDKAIEVPEKMVEASVQGKNDLARTPEHKETGPAKKSSKDTKQIAQEVWKKYGEAGAEVTPDGWKLPPVEILDNTPEIEFSQADNLKKAKLIEEALGSYGVEGKVVQINVGPTVTQFGLEPGWDRKLKEIKEKDKNGDVQVKVEEVSKTRVKVDRITSLANDLSLALAAPSIRIEAPVPGKSVVGIEVPNNTIGVVSLRGVVESNNFQKVHTKASLAIALGKGAGGESVVGDLTKMPHLLIAGATGSGKTVCIHTIICCVLLYCSPGDVRFIMIDPKRVELTSYNSLPHLATPVIVDTKKALGALRWLTLEMDKRYQTLAAARFRNIEAYNRARPNDKLPFLVLVIDELADLMMTSGEEVEPTLCRLAQLARAVGIHLVVATQRPSVDVVTGLIKANFPSRISFAVTSQVDSRTILDAGGAEKLLGRGDMLYMPSEASKAKRLQGCFVSDAEIERLVYFWNNQRKEDASQLKLDDLVAADAAILKKTPADPLLEQARKLLDEHDHISASFLQRQLRIGYPRAARLMEDLEKEMGEGITELEDITEEEENLGKEDKLK
jgi:DNA segregation ATPase FtsK/SpoIIIE, S-DNA-T family